MASLGALPPAWESESQPAPEITAGNRVQMSDAAAAMLIADRATAERLGLPIRARFRHFSVLADDPVLVLSAPNPVTRRLLERTGMTIDQFDAMECNEAPALAVLMAVTLAPTVFLLATSLTPLDLTQPATIGDFTRPARNYWLLLEDGRFLNSLWVQARLSFWTVGLQLLIGLGFALLLNMRSSLLEARPDDLPYPR